MTTLSVAGLGLEAEHEAPGKLGFGGMPLAVGEDAVGRVGEPDAPVRLDHHVVGRVESRTLIVSGEGGDGAVGLHSFDATMTLGAHHQPPLQIQRPPVGELDISAVDFDTILFAPAHDPVVGDVAPDDRSLIGQPGWALRPDTVPTEMFDTGSRIDQVLKGRILDHRSAAHVAHPGRRSIGTWISVTYSEGSSVRKLSGTFNSGSAENLMYTTHAGPVIM